MSGYEQSYAAWRADPEAYWARAAQAIDWIRPADKVFDPEMGKFGRWFAGAQCNTCWNCVDRHVQNGRGDQTALIWDSPVTKSVRRYSFAQLLDEVGALAAVMQDQGVTRGDRVIIYMPMVAEAVFAMLACARLGAVHSVVFGGFAAHELSARIDDATPKLVISASCGLENTRIVEYKPLLDQAIADATHKPASCVILQREAHRCEMVTGRDVDMAEAVAQAKEQGRRPDCVPVEATDPLYILYTSGTTGQPKGVVRDNGSHMVALHWAMENHYGTRPGDVFWAASDVGWVVGHSYICYGPLLQGCATVVFEGKPVGCPDAGVFWRVIQDHKVNALFAAPTAFRAIRKEDPQGEQIGKYDLSQFRTLFLAGERSDPDTVKWAQSKLDRPVIDHWWQTETGWAISGNPVGLGAFPIRLGSPGKPMPGYDVQVLDDDGHPVAPGTLGNIVLKLPLPPSCFPTLWNAPERYQSAYFDEFPGYYATSDAGIIDEDGYVFIMARTDDIINVAGHRLSTGAMEEVITSHPDIAECAVVGVADALKGQMPVGFYVTNSGVQPDPERLERELVALVRQEIGPVAAFKTAIEVERLPKTRSGKVLRGTIQKIADDQPWKMPAAIDDPAILQEIKAVLQNRGYAHQPA
ncbi:propionyl-CoA synthetase [Paracoccus seriniphilus]|uniref:Propionyl-CoA synthetase n=1 Tax=Paracoccus seriniphilus TaxID=184748 RepID=A0A239Q1D8_9RHOB|nr:propionyl-CoA synthetase [Paracoccus seriniphilus]WCR15901.1 propionyl-CoA synthetase [Paracoccus seriniphilus]SNT76324.1 propionyl-CoA synthetase [Paracoccus seriniphilus]